MGFWAWFGIWASLAIAALIALSIIGYELFSKSEATLHQLDRLLKNVEPLEEALSTKSKSLRPAESLLEPGVAVAERKALIKAREQKAADRQRRLVARLKDLKIDESRFR